MSRLFPFRSPVDRGEDAAPRLVDIDDDVADDVFTSLRSRTAREILATLYEDPHTASELAAAVDTSLQNASYHLDKLVDADLVEVVDTWYSERGTEMKVYAPTDESLVVFGGADRETTFRKLLARLVGGVALVGAVGFVVYRALRTFGGQAASGNGEPNVAPPVPTNKTQRDEAATSGGNTGINDTVTSNSTNATTTAPDPSNAVDPGRGHDLVTAAIPPELLLALGVTLVVATLLAVAWRRAV